MCSMLNRWRHACLVMCLVAYTSVALPQSSITWFRMPYTRPPCDYQRVDTLGDVAYIPVNFIHLRHMGLYGLGFAPACARHSLLPPLSSQEAVQSCLSSLSGAVVYSSNLGQTYSCVTVRNDLARVHASVFGYVDPATNLSLTCMLGGYVAGVPDSDTGSGRLSPVPTASVTCSSDMEDWYESTSLPTPITGASVAVVDGYVLLTGGNREDVDLQNVLFRIRIISSLDGTLGLDVDWEVVAYTSPVGNRLFPFTVGVTASPALLTSTGKVLDGPYVFLGSGMRNASATELTNASLVSLSSAVDGMVYTFDTWTIKPSNFAPLPDPRIVHVTPSQLWSAYSMVSPAVPSVDRGSLVTLLAPIIPANNNTTPLLLFSGSGAFLSKNLGTTWSMVQHRLAASRLESSIVPGGRAQLWTRDESSKSVILIVSDREQTVYRGYFAACNDTCEEGYYYTGCTYSPYDGRCMPCTQCVDGQSFLDKACRSVHQLGWSDAVCRACSTCDGSYVKNECNTTMDTVCSSSAPVSAIGTILPQMVNPTANIGGCILIGMIWLLCVVAWCSNPLGSFPRHDMAPTGRMHKGWRNFPTIILSRIAHARGYWCIPAVWSVYIGTCLVNFALRNYQYAFAWSGMCMMFLCGIILSSLLAWLVPIRPGSIPSIRSQNFFVCMKAYATAALMPKALLLNQYLKTSLKPDRMAVFAYIGSACVELLFMALQTVFCSLLIAGKTSSAPFDGSQGQALISMLCTFCAAMTCYDFWCIVVACRDWNLKQNALRAVRASARILMANVNPTFRRPLSATPQTQAPSPLSVERNPAAHVQAAVQHAAASSPSSNQIRPVQNPFNRQGGSGSVASSESTRSSNDVDTRDDEDTWTLDIHSEGRAAAPRGAAPRVASPVPMSTHTSEVQRAQVQSQPEPSLPPRSAEVPTQRRAPERAISPPPADLQRRPEMLSASPQRMVMFSPARTQPINAQALPISMTHGYMIPDNHYSHHAHHIPAEAMFMRHPLPAAMQPRPHSHAWSPVDSRPSLVSNNFQRTETTSSEDDVEDEAWMPADRDTSQDPVN